MATINIRRDNPDPFYRYKMEPLISKIEGKGNGIKSVIVNLSSVAQQLSRSPQYLVKFFGFELGAQVKTNPTDDRWIINGAHEASKLQDYLDIFINKFVLCKECKNPETDLIITKDQHIIRDCKACGKRTDVDGRHRLSSFILKNPPANQKKSKTSKRDAKSKKNGDDKEKNGNGSNSGEENSQEGEVEQGAGSDDEFTRRINKEAKALADQDAKEEDDEDWAVDMSEAAVKARAAELEKTLKATKLDDDEDDESGPSGYETLGSWLISERKNGKEADDVDIYKKMVELGIEKKHKTLQVLAQTLFDENIVKQIEPRASLLKKIITSDRHEKAFLGGTERLIGQDHPSLIPQVPKILMNYYQHDLVSEETVTAWGSSASRKYVDISVSRKVRKAAAPFLKWLEEADEDEEDSDDEE